MDMEFDELKTTLSQLINNTSAAWEHVAKVEWQIRVLKERWKEILSSFPLKQLPNILIIHLLPFVTMWLNAFSVKHGVSSKLRPRE